MKKCYLFLIAGMLFLTLSGNSVFAQVTGLKDTKSDLTTSIDVGSPANGFTGSNANFYAAWTGQAGANSYIVGIYANGTDLSGSQILPSSVTSVSFAPAKQNAGTIISIKVVSYSNALGNIGTAISPGVVVDTLINQGQVNVVDSTGATISFQSSTTTIKASWGGFTDPTLNTSGVASSISYQWAVGTTPYGTDIQGFTVTGVSGVTATTPAATPLSLAPNTTYYVTVQATNSAGISIQAASGGVTIKPTTTSATDLSGNATTISIPVGSGVINFVNVLNPVTNPTGFFKTPPPTNSFPFGVFSYTISAVVPYATVNVTYALSSAPSAGTRWLWYNATTTYWTDITTSVTPAADGTTKTFVLALQDNGVGDSNSTLGVITDPIGPAISSPVAAPESTGQRIANSLGLGGGGSCGVIGLDAIALVGTVYLFRRRLSRRKK